MTKMYFGLFIAMGLLLLSCDSGDPRKVLPGKIGPIGELVVVIPQAYWESEIVDAIIEFTGEPYRVLPQAENTLDLVLLDPSEFSRFYKPHRNILVVDLADRIDTQEPSLKIYRNRYASDQVYAEAKGKTKAAIASAIRERGDDLIATIHKAEVRRVGALATALSNEPLIAELEEKYKLAIDFPRDARKVKSSEDFIWIQREMTRMKGGSNHDVKQGFFIYTYPYTTDSVFSFDWLIDKRNAVLQQYVFGQPDGSFMTTEMMITPRYEEHNFKGMFMGELRGLWRMENDFMGGPFYSMTLYDEKNSRIVTVEGYTYAPYFPKREYIREVEGILKTIRF